MKKIKPPLFSPTQFAEIMNENIGGRTIHAAISRNYCVLQDHVFEPLLGLNKYAELLESIQIAIDDPALQAKLMADWENEVYEEYKDENEPNEKITILLDRARYACLYIGLARAALKRGDIERAWAFNNEASLNTGEAIAESTAILQEIEDRKCTAQNSKNAKGRTKNFLPAKQEAARLLNEMKPDGGWPSVASAALALNEPMQKFINMNRIGGIKGSNIQTLLEKTWIPKDPLVNNAWLNSKQT